MPLSNLKAAYLRAEAINHNNKVLGSTGVIDVKTGKIISMDTAISNVIDDVDDTITLEDSESALILWDFSRGGREWKITLEVFIVLGMVLSFGGLTYAIILRSRCSRKAHQYSSL